ncbi:hypothetical protein BDF21DRAFT_405128 [Thamnidium elegans]|nr:hypothetical protein BDF21DRAFT_405128 [Thamnidium elegans]
MSITITKEQALCMLFYKPYTEENVKTLMKKLEALEGFELCYTYNMPTKPIIVYFKAIAAKPSYILGKRLYYRKINYRNTLLFKTRRNSDTKEYRYTRTITSKEEKSSQERNQETATSSSAVITPRVLFEETINQL